MTATAAPARRLASLRGLGAAGWIGVVLVGGLVALAILAPLVGGPDPAARVGTPYAPPSSGSPLGTDDVGRDLWAQLVYGARTSLLVGLGVGTLSLAIGVVVGTTAGIRRGGIETFLMRGVDVVMVLPFLPMLIAVAAFAGRDLVTQVVVISALTWARAARLIRAQTVVALERGHARASTAMGGTRVWTVLRHASRDVGPLLIPLFIRAAMTAVLLEASLSFLGLGDPQRVSWGTTLFWANARSVVLTDAWLWWVVPPGIAIGALVLGLALVGLMAEERLNPELGGGLRA